ncbi:MAG: SRPBCC family protein [Terriglobia bacterium]
METIRDQDFTTTISVDQSPREAFDAINDVRSWWTGDPGVEGNTRKLGDEFTYRYQDLHYSKQKIVEFVPEKRITWLVTDCRLSFVKNQHEWTDTKITFDISRQGNKTQIRFTHLGLVPKVQCFDDCSGAWESYVTDSLRKFIANRKRSSSKRE